MEQVEELANLFSNSDTIIIADYKGTSVSDLSSLRKALNSSSSKFKIAKNTLAKLAAEKAEKNILADQINGPLGYILTNEDPSQVTKTIFDYTEKNNIKFVIKKGLLDNELVDESTLVKLSKLPSKDILLSQLMGSMMSPLTSLVFVMNGTVQALATVIQRYVEKTEEVKTEEVKTEEVKTEEVKTEEVKTEEVKTEEVKTEEVKTEEVKTEEVKTEEVKTEEVKTEEVKKEK
jgi:large subunit ribosomal protein L10